MAKGEVTKELRRIYEKAWKEGIWIKEFGGGSGHFLAGAGDVADIERIEKQLGREIDINKDLSLGDVVMNIPSLPGNGKTREEACRNAVKAWKKHKRGKRSTKSG